MKCRSGRIHLTPTPAADHISVTSAQEPAKSSAEAVPSNCLEISFSVTIKQRNGECYPFFGKPQEGSLAISAAYRIEMGGNFPGATCCVPIALSGGRGELTSAGSAVVAEAPTVNRPVRWPE